MDTKDIKTMITDSKGDIDPKSLAIYLHNLDERLRTLETK